MQIESPIKLSFFFEKLQIYRISVRNTYTIILVKPMCKNVKNFEIMGFNYAQHNALTLKSKVEI